VSRFFSKVFADWRSTTFTARKWQTRLYILSIAHVV
jgi:hypothetical protein